MNRVDFSKKRHLRFILVAGIIVGLDQLTKALVVANIPAYHTVSVISGFFNLTRIYNTGGAFGFLSGHPSGIQQVLFLTASILATGLILFLYGKTPPGQAALEFGFSLILGGAAGNVIDRIRIGKVIDFLDFHIMGLHWPAFNVADSAITLGMLIFIYHLLFNKLPET
jgi:signal peptidase II